MSFFSDFFSIFSALMFLKLIGFVVISNGVLHKKTTVRARARKTPALHHTTSHYITETRHGLTTLHDHHQTVSPQETSTLRTVGNRVMLPTLGGGRGGGEEITGTLNVLLVEESRRVPPRRLFVSSKLKSM